MADLTIKANSTFPYLEATLEENGVALNLTNAEEVHIRLKYAGTAKATLVRGGTTSNSEGLEWAQTSGGKVTYKWKAADLETSGSGQLVGVTLPVTIEIEWEVKWKSTEHGGATERFPSTGVHTVEVVATL
jgi:hypothetical protein